MKQKINWRQAIADVVLLAIGVGLALVANSWIDNVRERAEEMQYLKALERDFKETRSSCIETIEANRSTLESNIEFLGILNGPREGVPSDRIIELLARAFRIKQIAPAMGAYHDMVNSGDLRLLQNARLRLALAKFEGSLGSHQRVEAEGLEQWNLMQAPYLVEHIDLGNLSPQGYRGLHFSVGAKTPECDVLWAGEFANLLIITVISRQDIVVSSQDLLVQIEDILQLIEGSSTRE
jgi:hypothetical protein